ncbi:XRE family transcriptional regulator [Streptomyces sp. SDr-06]|nr:XRE family transcriptional regulator [Streptomyces sp. SDr-06]
MALRYILRDREILRWIMDHPGRGAPYSIRTLSDATGVSRSQLGRLLSGDREALSADEAHSVTEALGVAVLVLFAPPPSPWRDESSTD